MANGDAHHIEVLNPATLSVVEQVPTQSAADLDATLRTASTAREEWLRVPQRSVYLEAVSELIAAETESIAQVLTAEQGKPLTQARLEVGVAARAFAYYAGQRLAPEVLHDDERRRVERHFHPLGVAGLITAWNFPVALLAWKAAPALLAGNAVIIKPAPTTPLSALRLQGLLDKVFPQGLVQTLVGGNDLGEAIVTHPGIGKISFTGSTQTGRAIMAGSAPYLKRLTLELGGNDPAVLLPDADLAAAVSGIAAVAFRNAGQVCIAPKRVYVPRDLHDEVVDRFVDHLRGQRVGDGADEQTTIGPVQNAAQATRLTRLRESVAADGGLLHAGASGPGDLPGYFVQPAVVTGLDESAELVREEQFGPLLPVLAYDDVDAVVRSANRTEFGLGASVWSRDLDAAVAVADRLDAGTRWVNQHGPAELDIPFGGVKQSGLGSELGREGLLAFTESRITNIKKQSDRTTP